MDQNRPSGEGIPGSPRRLAEAFLSTLQNRVELLALDLQEEKYWLITALIWAALAIFLCILAVLLVIFTIVFLSPERARPYVLLGLCFFLIALALGAVAGLRRQWKEKATPLSDTLSELKKDVACLRSRD